MQSWPHGKYYLDSGLDWILDWTLTVLLIFGLGVGTVYIQSSVGSSKTTLDSVLAS